MVVAPTIVQADSLRRLALTVSGLCVSQETASYAPSVAVTGTYCGPSLSLATVFCLLLLMAATLRWPSG